MLQERKDSKYAIMKAHRLMQQYIVMAYARDQSRRLNFYCKQVCTKRQANYRDIGRNLNNENMSGIDHGKKSLSLHHLLEVLGGTVRKIWSHWQYLDKEEGQIYLLQSPVIQIIKTF